MASPPRKCAAPFQKTIMTKITPTNALPLMTALLLAACGGSTGPDSAIAQASGQRAAMATAPAANEAVPAEGANAAPVQLTIASGSSASTAAAMPAKTPLRTGGTVHNLIGNWTGKGFHLLTTAPAAPVYTKSPHSGSVWDGARQTMWIFGAEAHKTQMDNAVYGWRASDGLFVKHYDADPSSGYRMDAAGIYWSSAAKNRPWAMHTYRRMRMVPGTDEFEVMYDPAAHAYMNPPIFENPAHTTLNRVPVIWYYNVVSGTWRHQSIGSSAKFVGASYAHPAGYDPAFGWFSGDGSFWKRLSPTGVYSTTGVSGKSNGQHHSYMFVKNSIAYRVAGNSNTVLYSRHPLSNVTLSQKFNAIDFPQLAGYTLINMAAAMMSDGRIVIFPVKGSEMHAMILDPVANTVTPTGHVVTGMDKATMYELAAEWSAEHQAVILLSRRFSAHRVYAYRP